MDIELQYEMASSFKNAQDRMALAFENTQDFMQHPHILMKPKVYWDGDHWCCQLGDDITGIVGFGDTPAKACSEFDMVWWKGDQDHVKRLSGTTPVGE